MRNLLGTFITVKGGRLSFFSNRKSLVYQKPQKLIAFPCLLMGLLGGFVQYLGSRSFVFCHSDTPFVCEMPDQDEMLPIFDS